MTRRSTKVSARRLAFIVLALASPPGLSAAGAATASERTEVVVHERPPGPALPYFDEVSIEYRVVLSSKIKEAVINAYPGFAPWNQSDYFPKSLRAYEFSRYSTPTTVVGDFNGDGKTDVVLLGHDARGDLVLAVLSSNDSDYEVIPVAEGSFDFFREEHKPIPIIATWMLEFHPKGKKYQLSDMYPKDVALETDAFLIRSLDVYAARKLGITSDSRYRMASLYWWDAGQNKFLSSAL